MSLVDARIRELNERISELLRFNNEFEERARAAERALKALTTPTPSDGAREALADKLDTIFDRIEVSCDWGLSSEERQEIAKAAKALRAPQRGVQTEQAPLDWLAERKNYELSFSGYDEDPAWLVHSVNGNRNDREWTLLATGDTPEKALRKAMSLALPSADRGSK
jgi:hypothetical protein